MYETTAVVMAKKPSKRTPKALEPDRQPMIVQMRGSEEFKAYVGRVAEFDRNTVAKMVEKAIIHFAKSIGYDETPPKR